MEEIPLSSIEQELSMRLSKAERQALITTAKAVCSEVGAFRLWLFGSRVDDGKRGGDIDLLLEIDSAVESARALASLFRCRLFPQLGERKIDVVVKAANTPSSAFFEIIDDQKVLLCQSD